MAQNRLSPTIFSSRYVHLVRLKNQTINAIKQITAQNKNLILVDFGCGNMPYRSVIEPLVGEYIGVDLEMNPAADHHIGFDSKTTLPNNYCDIVLSNQVLEHVDSPDGYLKEAFRILKPSGSLIISTHGFWQYHPSPNDFWRWTSAGLKKIIINQGFKIVLFNGIMGLAASAIQLFQDAIVFKLPKFMVPPFALLFQTLILLFDNLNSKKQRDRDASVYVVIALKNDKLM